MKLNRLQRLLSVLPAVLMPATCPAGLILPASAVEVSVLNGTGCRGDVAPSGRFQFSFISTAENAMGQATETRPVDTQPVTDPEETPAPETEAPEKEGCRSTVTLGFAVTLMAMVAAVALKKKD